MFDENGKFNKDGPITEIRWIAEHPSGYYQMDKNDRTDYMMNTKSKYASCTVIHSPYLRN